jgi:hypothetical protein
MPSNNSAAFQPFGSAMAARWASRSRRSSSRRWVATTVSGSASGGGSGHGAPVGLLVSELRERAG